MLTLEQVHAASLALLPDLEKYHAYIQYKQACKGMVRYGLPFRVYLDYLKRPHKQLDDITRYIEINPLYPQAGFKIDEVKTVCFEDFTEPHYTASGALSFDESQYTYEDLSPELQKEIQNDIDPVLIWKLYDKSWEYYFAHFLKGYDFKAFTEFDFYGLQGQQSQSDIQLLQNIYRRLQQDYDRNPNNYMNEEPTISASEYIQYQAEPFYICIDRNKAQERDSLIDKHKQGYKYTDDEFTLVYGYDRNENFNYIGREV